MAKSKKNIDAPVKPTADSEIEWRSDSFATDLIRVSPQYRKEHERLKRKLKGAFNAVKSGGYSNLKITK